MMLIKRGRQEEEGRNVLESGGQEPSCEEEHSGLG